MEVKWLLEKNLFPEENFIIDEISKRGHECKFINSRICLDPKKIVDLFDHDDCVIFYGSLGMASIIRRHAPWIPGIYCDLPKYECVYYYPRIGRYLLNEDYVMLPFGELTRRKNWLMEHFGIEGKIFVRPSSPFKIFGGKVIEESKWNDEISFLNFHTVEPERVVVVSSPKKIVYEWRLVVVDGKAISGSQYIKNDEIESDVCPDRVIVYANDILSKCNYNPERVWCLDICELDNGTMSVLEVGAFSTSGLYLCPLEPIIREVSKVAEEEWNDIYSI